MEKRKKYLVIDFDSTFVKVEALDYLTKISLLGSKDKKKILFKVTEITKQGMEGKISFSKSLNSRLKMLSFKKRHVEKLASFLKGEISVSIRKNKAFFLKNADSIYIISGGFEDYILPVVLEFGIPADHVIANRFVFDELDNVLGADQKRPLVQDDGKVLAIKQLGLKGKICVIGDGFTDYRIKQAGYADTFCAFCENVRRESVVKNADFEVSDFSILIKLLYA